VQVKTQIFKGNLLMLKIAIPNTNPQENGHSPLNTPKFARDSEAGRTSFELKPPELIASIHPGFPAIPGAVTFNSIPLGTIPIPNFAVGELVHQPGKLKTGGLHSVVSGSDDLAKTTALYYVPLGHVVMIKPIDTSTKPNSILNPHVSAVYFKPSSAIEKQLQEALQNSKNNVVDFTRNLSKMAGPIGELGSQVLKML
jgi:hypothetical protein